MNTQNDIDEEVAEAELKKRSLVERDLRLSEMLMQELSQKFWTLTSNH